MRKIRCPKCDQFIRFEESRIEPGASLILHCDSCGKSFSVRFKSKEEKKEEVDYTYGCIIVVENVFCEKQIIPLQLGENMLAAVAQALSFPALLTPETEVWIECTASST